MASYRHHDGKSALGLLLSRWASRDMEGLDPLQLFIEEADALRQAQLELAIQTDKLRLVEIDMTTQVPLLTEPYLLATCADGRLAMLIVVIKPWSHFPSTSFVLPLDDLLAAHLAEKVEQACFSWTQETRPVTYVWSDSISPSQVGLGHLPWVYPTDTEVLDD